MSVWLVDIQSILSITTSYIFIEWSKLNYYLVINFVKALYFYIYGYRNIFSYH